MIVELFPSGPLVTNAIVVGCTKTQQAAIIDPAPGSADNVLTFLKDNRLTATKILLTHSHWDHIADVARLKEILKIPVYIHPADRANLEKPGCDGIPMLFPVEGCAADRELHDGDRVSVGEIEFEVIHTAGHSPGGICLYSEANQLLISGDTLFKGSIGVLSLPNGDPDAMWDSLNRLSRLPPATTVYPGHGEPTTIGEESWLPRAKELFSNPYIQ